MFGFLKLFKVTQSDSKPDLDLNSNQKRMKMRQIKT